MKFLKGLIVTIVVFVLALVLVGFLPPSQWKVERSVIVNAPAKVIYPFVANFKTGWPQWSTFDYEDPSIQYSYSGPEVGLALPVPGFPRKWGMRRKGLQLRTRLQGLPSNFKWPKTVF